MIPDPIKVAQQKVKLNNLGGAVSKQNTAAALSKVSVADALQAGKNLKELPIQPDPELIKKEAIAKAHTLRAEAEQLVQQKKEEELAKVKDKVDLVSGLVGKAVAAYIKLPVLDPKFLAYMAYLKAKQKIRELKQTVSKENLKKSKEAFTHPMKPMPRIEVGKLTTTQLPKIPEIPKIPSIPAVPTVTTPVTQKKQDFTYKSGMGAEQDAKDEAARRSWRHAQVVRMQEERVAKAKRYVDFQNSRLANAPGDTTIQAAYNNATKVYEKLVAYLDVVKKDPNITELTQ